MRHRFDVEHMRNGWHGFDLRLWPTCVRLYHRRRDTTSGVEHRVGLYRFARWERAIDWWVAR